MGGSKSARGPTSNLQGSKQSDKKDSKNEESKHEESKSLSKKEEVKQAKLFNNALS